MEPEKKSEIKFRLARVLGLSDATFIGVGALLGGGIFTLTGLALSYAGPSMILVVVLNGIIALMTALAYAELGSTFPGAGGAFIWVRKGLGNLAGHITGWISWFANAVACGLYSLSFSFYFGTILFSTILSFFGIDFVFAEGGVFQKIVAIAIILFIGWINYRGISGTSRFGKIIVYLEILVLSSFIVFGLISFFKKPDITVSLATSFGPLFPMGIFGLLGAMGLMYIGFEGSEIIVQSGEELKNPRKNIPRAILLSIGIVCVLYLLTIFTALTGVPNASPSWEILAEAGQGALVKAAGLFRPGLEWVMLFGGILAASAALNATIFSSSHVSFSMGRSGTLPNFLAKIHPKNKTPYVAIIFSTVLVLIIAGLLPLKEVAAVTDLLFIFLFIQLHLALIALRKKMPGVERPFKVPLYPVPSLVAITAYSILIYQFFHISPIGLAIVIFWMLLGFLIYYAYSKPVEIEKIEKEIVFEEKVRVTEKKKYRILLPIRPDPNWPNILALALAIAKQKDAEITVLYVKKIPKPLPLQVEERDLEEGKKFLEGVMSLSRDSSGVNITSLLVVSRSITKAIIELIQKENPNLLVLHWKGYTKMIGVKHKIFGRKLDIILREAKCDLIVARIHQLSDLKNMLLPSVGGPHAKLAGETASIISEVFGGKIRVMYAATKKEAEKIDPAEKLKNIVSSLEIPSCTPVKSGLVYAKSASSQAIAYQIIQESQDFGCILIASAKARIFHEMLFGNIPEIVARNSSKSLILVKHHETIMGPIIAFIYNKLG